MRAERRHGSGRSEVVNSQLSIRPVKNNIPGKMKLKDEGPMGRKPNLFLVDSDFPTLVRRHVV